jgi:hypothetical protein
MYVCMYVGMYVCMYVRTYVRTYEGSLKSSWTHLITPFTCSRSGWRIAKSTSLAKECTSKKRPSPHLHKVPTRSNKVSLRTFQTALVAPPS